MPSYLFSSWSEPTRGNATYTNVAAPISGSLDNLAHLTGAAYGSVIKQQVFYQDTGPAPVPVAASLVITPTKLAMVNLPGGRRARRRGR